MARRKRGRSSNIRVLFVLITFGIMSLSTLVIGLTASFIIRFDLVRFTPHGPIYPLLVFMLISVALGTVISSVVSNRILRPILRISEATKEVAKGNFQVVFNEEGPAYEINEMAHNFNLMVQGLASIETLRNDFVVNVSHEFKTPIAAIEGYASLLQQGGLSEEEQNHYAATIAASARQLTTLTGNILKLSRLETQEFMGDAATPFRLDEQIRQVLLLCMGPCEEKRLELDLQLDRVILTGHEQFLHQVWLNLLENAIKFTPVEGRVSVKLTQREGWAIAVVEDSGVGMSPQVMRHMYDKFYQGDAARNEPGNGLGLSLVRKIVTLCGGEIEAQSQEGVGTIFTVRLPLEGSTGR